MKKRPTIHGAIIALLVSLLIPAISLAQHKGPVPQATPQPYFFIHGWSLPKPIGSGSGQVTSVAGDMQTRFGWMSDQLVLPDYSGFIPTILEGVTWVDGYASTGVHAQLYNAYPSGGYIGLGYSEGGMFARYEALTYGAPFMTGLVTDHTPNNGTWIGDFSHREDFISRFIDAEGRMLRGDLGILAWVFNGLVNALGFIVWYVSESVNLLATLLLGGLPQDAAPGSAILNTLNGTQPAVKRVAVWGQTEYPYYAYYSGDANGVAWVDGYNQARQNSHDNDDKANSIHPHWYDPWKWADVWWYRSRAGDWTATANAMNDVEDDWEDNTAGRGVVSDGLVGVSSQEAIPSPDAVVEDGYSGHNVNHGNAMADADATLRDHVQTAMSDAGAHSN